MFRCPHCCNKGISSLRKLILSPGTIANCDSCGGASSIGYPSWLLAMLPGSILMIVALFVDSTTAEWLLNIVGIVLMVTLSFLFTPLQAEK
jgi:hypothetical protein